MKSFLKSCSYIFALVIMPALSFAHGTEVVPMGIYGFLTGWVLALVAFVLLMKRFSRTGQFKDNFGKKILILFLVKVSVVSICTAIEIGSYVLYDMNK